MSNKNYIYMIRRQRSSKTGDVERFWPYKTKEEAERVAATIQGYKVTVEKHYTFMPYDKWIESNKVRFPKE